MLSDMADNTTAARVPGRPHQLDDYEWHDPAVLAAPPHNGFYEVWADAWWPIDEQGRVALLNPVNRRTGERTRPSGAPQCNPSESLARALAPRIHPWAVDIVKIPLVFLRHDCAEYR